MLRSVFCVLAFALPIWGQELTSKPDAPKQESIGTMAVLASFERDEPILRFDWGEKKPALAVVKGLVTSDGGKWWIVFDESANVALPDIIAHPVPGIKSIETISTQESVVLLISTDSQLTPVIVQEGSKWQISFQSHPMTHSHQASIRLPQTKGDGLVVVLASSEKYPGKEVRFVDPHTGYTQIVFPTHQVGFGIDQDQVFPEFSILASAQGVGFQLIKDDLTIQTAPTEVTIMHPNGLAISLPQERDQVRTYVAPIGVFVDAKDLDWPTRLQKINESLIDLPHEQHGPGELEIAWLLMSNGQAAQAMGYLSHLAQERPSITDLHLFQMLRGMGNLLLNRLSESEQQLSVLREEPEVQIWLSLISALQQPKYYAASPASLSKLRVQFQIAREMLKSYPKPLRTQMVTLLLMAGIALGDVETLSPFLEQEMRPENLSAAEVYDLARARVLLSQNKPDAALQILGELMEKASSPQVRAIARFDYVTYRLHTKMIREEDALAQLESLRSHSHGGWFDRQVAAYLVAWKARKG